MIMSLVPLELAFNTFVHWYDIVCVSQYKNEGRKGLDWFKSNVSDLHSRRLTIH
jgi:hypothetical protein